MSFNIQQILPLIIGSISISGILFKTWQHDKKLEILDSTVEVQRKRINNNYLIINEIHSNTSILEGDISYMKQDIHDIKNKLDSKK